MTPAGILGIGTFVLAIERVARAERLRGSLS